MSEHFFPMIARMRYITRWGLMRNTDPENIQEHSHMVAVLAHALAVVGQEIFHKDVNPDRVATAALFHDAPEIITGDLPPPIKYFNPAIKSAYDQVEAVAQDKLLGMLPPELTEAYAPLLRVEDPKVRCYIKAADKLAAWLKCLEERKAGNREFVQAEEDTLHALKDMNMDEVTWFLEHMGEAFGLTLDELG